MAVQVDTIFWGYRGDESVTWWCRGHVDRSEFADAVRAVSGEEVAPATVMHYWGRWVPCRSGDFDRRLLVVDGRARGAFPFTVRETVW